MFHIQDTIVSLDILEKEFCCDLESCKGCCCIEGDAGAPLTDEEEKKLQAILPVLLPDMTKEARQAVEERGLSYFDLSGERVTQIVNGKDCVFARTAHNGWCYCLIERHIMQAKSTSKSRYRVISIRYGSRIIPLLRQWSITDGIFAIAHEY